MEVQQESQDMPDTLDGLTQQSADQPCDVLAPRDAVPSAHDRGEAAATVGPGIIRIVGGGLGSAELGGREDEVMPRAEDETSVDDRRARVVPTNRRLFSLLRPYRGRVIISVLLLMVTSGLGLLFPLVVGSMVSTILSHRNTRLLDIVALGLLLVFVLQAVLGAVQSYLITAVGERLSAGLRTDVFHHLQQLPMSFFDQRRSGELISRVTNDVTVLQTALTSNVVPVASQIFTLVGATAIAATISWRLTVVVVVVGPIAGLTAGLLGKRIREATIGVQEGLGEAGVVLEEALTEPRVVKAFAREEYEEKRFGDRISDSLTQALRRAWAQAALGPTIGLIGFTAVVIILWEGGHEVLAGQLTAASLIAYVFYMILMIGPLVALVGLYSQIQAARAAAGRVFSLLDEPTDAPLDAARPEMPPVRGAIQFEDVTFAYPAASVGASIEAEYDRAATTALVQSAEPVRALRNLSFEIAPGQVVALVGPSGAGKTTTMSLLLRLYDPDAGIIRVDGRDIRAVRPDSLRRQMALVPQEPVLFGDSIAANIRYGRLDASDADVWAAAEAANARDFIEDLPDGMQSLVGERGTKLSAGQRQRIAIARALLRDPRILLLDEATASLDNESEALVQEALSRLMRGRTTLVIAHRLTTVERADLILVLDHGHVVERGTHAELLRRGGLYARLYTRDFKN